MVIVAYIGWIAYGAVAILPQHLIQPVQSPFVVDIASVAALLSFWGSFFWEKSPWSFYVYITFPIYFWREVLRVSGGSIFSVNALQGMRLFGLLKVLLQSSLVIAALQSMVVS